MPGGDASTGLMFAGGALGVDLGESGNGVAGEAALVPRPEPSVDEEAGIANVGASSGADVNTGAPPVSTVGAPWGLTGILLRPVDGGR